VRPFWEPAKKIEKITIYLHIEANGYIYINIDTENCGHMSFVPRVKLRRDGGPACDIFLGT